MADHPLISADSLPGPSEPALDLEPAAPRPWCDWLTRIARPALAVYWPLLFYLTHSVESVTVNNLLKPLQPVHPDKWAHVGAYLVLTALLVFARFAGRAASFTANITVGCVLAALYGVFDEVTQGMFGRTTSGADVTADLIAVSLVYIALMLMHPHRRLLPTPVLAARLVLASLIPLSGVLLFTEGFAIEAWRLMPSWLPFVRGDYLVHFLAPMLLTPLIALAAPLGTVRARRRANALAAGALVLAIGPAIELVQGAFDRGAEWQDLLAHVLGLAVVGLGWAGVAGLKAAKYPSRSARWNPTISRSEMGTVPAQQHHRFVGHAIIVGLMTLVSRFTGLVRDSVLAAVLGLSATADAFSIGFLIPNLFRRLFGEGALTAAFIPIYTDLVHKDRLTARRLASMSLAVMLLFLGGVTLIGELLLAALLNSRDFTADTALAIRLTMIMLPYMPMICIVALVGGILQVHGRFAAPAAAPIFLNLVMVIGTIVAVNISAADTTQAVVIISWTVLIAGLVQLCWQFAMVLRFEKFTTVFIGAGPAFKSMLAMMVPMFIGLGVFQINTLCDYMIAFGLAAKEGGPEQLTLLGATMDYPVNTGDVAALNWAQRLYQFPLGVFGIAVATAIFPALARAAGRGGRTEERETGDRERETGGLDFQSILQHGLRLTFFIGLPASAGLILLRLPITRLIYERGQFDLAESYRVAFVMVGYASVVWAYSMTHVLTRGFYAMKDSKTPLKIGIAMVVVNVVLNLVLVWPLGVAGLAWASAGSAVLQVILLAIAIRRYVPTPIGTNVLRSWKMTAMLTAIMIAVLLPATMIFDAGRMTRVQSAIQLAILLPVGAAIVLGGAWLMKAEELTWLKRRPK